MVGLASVVGWVSACDDPDAGPADAADAGDAGDAGASDAGKPRPPTTDTGCHVDCLGGSECIAGVAKVYVYAPIPCSGAALTCPVEAQVTCSRGCAKAPPKVVAPPDVAFLCEGGLGDGTTGAACKEDKDCGALYRCSTTDPRPSCVLVPTIGESSCDPGVGAQRCDGALGVCWRAETTGVCEPGCVLSEAGTFVRPCPGKNACHPRGPGPDVGGSPVLYGTCAGGCRSDADCALGVCDPAVGFCSDTPCTGAEPCSAWHGAPRACVADVAGGKSHCRVRFPKVDGEACTGSAPGSFGAQCWCAALGLGPGVCASPCTTRLPGDGSDCGAGFACDPLFATTFSSWPAGVAGRCLKACATDADCPLPGLVCGQTAGMPTRTCRPG